MSGHRERARGRRLAFERDRRRANRQRAKDSRSNRVRSVLVERNELDPWGLDLLAGEEALSRRPVPVILAELVEADLRGAREEPPARPWAPAWRLGLVLWGLRLLGAARAFLGLPVRLGRRLSGALGRVLRLSR